MCPSLSSVSSAVPLGGEGLLGGLPLICHHQKERTKPHAPGLEPLQGCTGRTDRTEKKALPTRQFHLSQELKSPV